MALTVESVSKRLNAAAEGGYELSAKLYRVLQVLPSAVFEYGCFASLIMYLAVNCEQIIVKLPALGLTDDAMVLQVLEQLIDFIEEVYIEVKEALPQRQYDGAPVDLLLPFDTRALEDQIGALQVASTLVLSVLQLGETTSAPGDGVLKSTRFAEAVINELKKAIRDLKCSQPKEGKRRGTALKRAKTHHAITELLETMLSAWKTVSSKAMPNNGETATTPEEESKTPEDAKDKVRDVAPEEQELAKLGHVNADPKDDGMPEYMHHNPDNVYAKVHVDDVDTRSLDFYNLPFSRAKENPNYYIIWKPMENWECDNLFQHTKKLRINEAQATIQPLDVIRALLKKWLAIDLGTTDEVSKPFNFKELDEQLAELRAQDEKRTAYDRQTVVRDRSWSPSPTYRGNLPHSRRIPRHHVAPFAATSKTEYWRSWGGQTATLNNAMKFAGWQPVYMRGTDAGQTWFYGQDVIHVRRFTEDYTPQDGSIKTDKTAAEIKEYLIIGSEWVEEEALLRHSFQFHTLPSGHFVLDPRITWGDIEAVVYASAIFREERLYRKFRHTANGDLYEAKSIAVPDSDYLNGLPVSERLPRSRVPAPVTSNSWHVSHRLDNLPEEPAQNVFGRKQEVPTPGLESHDSFVEVDS